MKDREKVAWLQALLIIWCSAFTTIGLISLFGRAEDANISHQLEALKGFTLFILGVTLVYLLILSWRAAYLAGRDKR